MTLTQLRYAVALARYHHFQRAADACQVAQPTLSAQIKKLEDELDISIFDRQAQPIKVTPIGAEIIRQGEDILNRSQGLFDWIAQHKGSLQGDLRLSIIPTVAACLVPRFMTVFQHRYPHIKIRINESPTQTAISQLLLNQIDIAIMATPLKHPDLLEIPLYYEAFVVYCDPKHSWLKRKRIHLKDLQGDGLWLLEDEHCLRNQILNLCTRSQKANRNYEAGNIDTLIRTIDHNGGYTMIPELHVPLLTEAQQSHIRVLEPRSVREISIVIRKDYFREQFVNAIAQCIQRIVPEELLDQHLRKYRIKL